MAAMWERLRDLARRVLARLKPPADETEDEVLDRQW